MEADTSISEQALCKNTSMTSNSSSVVTCWCEVQKGDLPPHSSSCQAARSGSGLGKAQDPEPTIPATPSTPRQVAYRTRGDTEGCNEDSGKLTTPFYCSPARMSDAECRNDSSSLGRLSSASADEAPLSPVSADQRRTSADADADAAAAAAVVACSSNDEGDANDVDCLMAPSVVMQRILTTTSAPQHSAPAPMGLLLRPPGQLLAMLHDGGLKHQVASRYRSAPCTPLAQDEQSQLDKPNFRKSRGFPRPLSSQSLKKLSREQHSKQDFSDSNLHAAQHAGSDAGQEGVRLTPRHSNSSTSTAAKLAEVHEEHEQDEMVGHSSLQHQPTHANGCDVDFSAPASRPSPFADAAAVHEALPATCAGPTTQAVTGAATEAAAGATETGEDQQKQQHAAGGLQADVNAEQFQQQNEEQWILAMQAEVGSKSEQGRAALTLQLPEEHVRSIQQQQSAEGEQPDEDLHQSQNQGQQQQVPADAEQQMQAPQGRKLKPQQSVSKLVAMWETQRPAGEAETPTSPVASPRPRLTHSNSGCYTSSKGPISLEHGPTSPPRRTGSLSENGGILYSSSGWQRLRRTWQPPKSYVSWGGAAPSPAELPAEPSPKELVGDATTVKRQTFASLQRADTAPASMIASALRAVREDQLKSHQMLIPEDLEEDAVQSHFFTESDGGHIDAALPQAGRSFKPQSDGALAAGGSTLSHSPSESLQYSEAGVVSRAEQLQPVNTQRTGGVDASRIVSHSVAFSVSDDDSSSEADVEASGQHADFECGDQQVNLEATGAEAGSRAMYQECGGEEGGVGSNAVTDKQRRTDKHVVADEHVVEDDVVEWEGGEEGVEHVEWEGEEQVEWEGEEQQGEWEGEGEEEVDAAPQPVERHALRLDLPGWVVTSLIALAPLWKR